MLKFTGDSLRTFVWSQSISFKIIINYQEETRGFSMTKAGPRLALPAMRHINTMNPLLWCPVWEAHVTFVVFLPPEKQNFPLAMRIRHTNSNWTTVYKIPDQVSSRVSRSWKAREGQETASDYKRQRRHDTKCNVRSWTGS